jgi:hypothetical protein
MTHNPYYQNPADLVPIIGGTIRHAGVSREGFPYLVVENQNKTFYLFVQSDAEGNGTGYLSVTEKAGVEA